MLTPYPKDQLYREIADLDDAVFEAYNTCNLREFSNYFVDDLEFYHDKTGLNLTKKTLLTAMEAALCGNPDIRTRRELIPESLEVYPLDNFGAIQIGRHYYYRSIHGGPETRYEIARFTHIWQKKDGKWKIYRVMSYDHQPLLSE